MELRAIRASVLLGAFVSAFGVAATAEAASFRARYYPDCYEPVSQAREMVEPPPMDVAGTAEAVGQAANVLGKIGGFGGFGGLGKAASTAATVSRYSSVVSDVATFTKNMQEDYPDPATRLAAYGDRMGESADSIGDATLMLDGAQGCYENAFTELKAGVESGEIRSRDASNRQKEIQGGMDQIGDILSDATGSMDANMKAYNEALTNDSAGMGLNMGSIAQAASTGISAANLAGVGGGSYSTAAYQAMGLSPGAALANTKYAGYYDQSNAYSSAWWAAYNSNGGDAQAATEAAKATLGGAQAPVKGYQEAYWAAQAQGAGSMASSAMANYGTLKTLSSLNFSGTGGALLGANLAAGLVSNAMSSGQTAEPAPELSPETQAVQSSMASAGQAVGMANAMRGMSGTGGAWAAANMAMGMASSGGGNDAAGAEPQEMTPQMADALLKTSVDTEKFTAAYGLVSIQSQRHQELNAMFGEKLN